MRPIPFRSEQAWNIREISETGLINCLRVALGSMQSRDEVEPTTPNNEGATVRGYSRCYKMLVKIRTRTQTSETPK